MPGSKMSLEKTFLHSPTDVKSINGCNLFAFRQNDTISRPTEPSVELGWQGDGANSKAKESLFIKFKPRQPGWKNHWV